jgi:hypothetical protein
MIRRLLITATFASAFLTTAPALAKGTIPPRGYLVIDGPGLVHPVVFSSPWDGLPTSGYYGDEAELFMNLVDALADTTPLDHAPRASQLGPSYSVSYFLLEISREGADRTVRQVFFPQAAGGPLVHTPPGQDRSYPAVFGRYLTRPPATWGRVSADSMDLLMGWGLPAPAPRKLVANAVGRPPGSPSISRLTEAREGVPWVSISGALGLGLLLGAALDHLYRRPGS